MDVPKLDKLTMPLDVLSDRERTVRIGMIGGKRRSQIAEELHLSAHTVRTHTQSIYTKLGVHSRLAAVHVARSSGLPASHTPPPDANGSESGRTR